MVHHPNLGGMCAQAIGPVQSPPAGQGRHSHKAASVAVLFKYSVSLQLAMVFQLRLRQVDDPSLGCCHPAGQSMQFVLGLVSCGWYHPAGHSLHSLDFSSRANLPLAHVRQSVVPSKLLLPCLQGAHSWVSSFLPTQPAGQAWNPAQISPVQLMRYEPGGTTTDAAPPPNAMELPDNSSHLTELGFTCNHP